jgi:hypothetical protein
MTPSEIEEYRRSFGTKETAELFKDLDVDAIKDFATSELVDIELTNLDENIRQRRYAQGVHPEVDINKLIDPVKRKNITSEQQFARDLIFDGIVPEYAPPDRFYGTDYKARSPEQKTQLGIDGPFQNDSEVRGHTRIVENADGTIKVKRGPKRVQTEILSPKGVRRIYDKWRSMPDEYGKVDVPTFNAFAGEYYGQQGLKVAGYEPVKDSERSYAQRSRSGQRMARPEDFTVGTDRLIETSPRLTTPEVSGGMADLRYKTPDGKIRIGDYQTGDIGGKINVSVLKNVKGVSDSEARSVPQAILRNMDYRANEALDKAIDAASKEGSLPPLAQGNRGMGRSMRAGKATSNAPLTGRFNTHPYDTTKSQFTMDDIVYGLGEKGWRDSLDGGQQPKRLLIADTGKMREMIGRNLTEASLNDEPLSSVIKVGPDKPAGRGVYSTPEVDRLTSGTKPARPLLDESSMRQISEPFNLGGQNVLRPKASGGPRGAFISQAGDTLKGILRSPVTRMAGTALAAVPILGDGVDAVTGAHQAITAKNDRDRKTGSVTAAGGITGLAALAAPVAAPVLAPMAVGLGAGSMLSDVAKSNRERQTNDHWHKGENSGAFISSDDNVVTISGPSKPQSSWNSRLSARRSTPVVTPAAPPPREPTVQELARMNRNVPAPMSEAERRRRARRGTR